MARTDNAPVVMSCTGVWKVFARAGAVVRAVKDVSLMVRKGDLLCISGPSGSGKSTLLSILGAIDLPTKGTVTAFDLDIARLSEPDRDRFRRECVGFVFQDLRLIAHLTAEENAVLPALFDGVSSDGLQRIGSDALERVGLHSRRLHFPTELSYGEQQRVAFARALVRSPRIVLADEPTANLDDDNADRIIELLSTVAESGVPCIVATHDPRLLRKAHRVLSMRDGQLVQADQQAVDSR